MTIHGAGRTDSGVHALGQVIHFDLPQARDEEKLRFALDTQTPEDIDFIRVEQVADDFTHATRSTARPMNYRGLWSSQEPHDAPLCHPLSLFFGCGKDASSHPKVGGNP